MKTISNIDRGNKIIKIWDLIKSVGFMSLIIVLAGCGGSGNNGGNAGTNSDLSITVDKGITPRLTSLPSIDGSGTPRPVAAVVDDEGRQAEFVENELWIVADDMSSLSTFLDRWEGKIISKFNPKHYHISGKSQYLVRINTNLANTSKLKEDILALSPNSYGNNRVSSAAGLGLLAAGASDAANGVSVGINWVGTGHSYAYRSTTDAPTGPSGFTDDGPYSNNAFDWHHLNAGSIQNIGVTEAWRLLEETGRIENRVKIAVLDMGFSPDSDFPSGWQAISNVPFVEAIGTPNLEDIFECSGCRWHGTNVVGAAMGVPDNAYGAAGPAGPVGDAVMVFTTGDFFMGITALGEAYTLGARIMNMSYGIGVPDWLSWTVIPFDLATTGFDAAGVLLFASAGNEGKDVDAERCTPWVGWPCWEKEWYTPCENSGVICVGGLGKNSKNKAGGSNYGHEHVDIFAPYTVMVGPDPDNPDNIAQSKNGTSFSSPYAAGVAALIKAANPALSKGEVKGILYGTAHGSPDDRVNRYVNAYDAVVTAMGESYVEIRNPVAGESFTQGMHFINLQSFVFQGTRGTPTLSWSSDRDGGLGDTDHPMVNTLAQPLSLGNHIISVEALFPDGFSVTDSIQIAITNPAPSVHITAPSHGADFFESSEIALGGTSFDPSPPSGALPDTQVSWYVGDTFLGTGHTFTIPGGSLGVGSHVIEFRGTDGESTAMDSVSITISEDPAGNVPPTVTITSHADGGLIFPDEMDELGWFKDVTFSGVSSDPEDGTITALQQWLIIDSADTELASGTGASTTIKLHALSCGNTEYRVLLRNTDSHGSIGSDLIMVNVNRVC